MGNKLRSRLKLNSTFLEAGIHEDVVISGYKNLESSAPNKQNFITFSKLNEDNKEVGRREISWFIYDSNGDYIYQNIQEHMGQLVGILELYYTEEEVNKLFIPFRNTDIETLDDLKDQIKRKSELAIIFENVRTDLDTLFEPILAAYADGDFSNKARLKLILKNNYVNPPNYGNFVESMKIDKDNSVLKLTIPEQKEIDKWTALTDRGAAVPVKKEKGEERSVSDIETLSSDEIMNQNI